MASLGLSAELAQKLTRDIKRRFGRLGYAHRRLASVLSRARPFSAIISSAEGTARVRTLQIAVGNGRYYGGGNAVENERRDRRPASRSLQPRAQARLEAGAHGPLVPLRRATAPGEEVRAIRSKEFDVRTRKPRPINADGEIVTQTPAHFAIRPGVVEVFAPRGG